MNYLWNFLWFVVGFVAGVFYTHTSKPSKDKRLIANDETCRRNQDALDAVLNTWRPGLQKKQKAAWWNEKMLEQLLWSKQCDSNRLNRPPPVLGHLPRSIHGPKPGLQRFGDYIEMGPDYKVAMVDGKVKVVLKDETEE